MSVRSCSQIFRPFKASNYYFKIAEFWKGSKQNGSVSTQESMPGQVGTCRASKPLSSLGSTTSSMQLFHRQSKQTTPRTKKHGKSGFGGLPL